MAKAWVGVYWTLPVNWVGFRDLPRDVDAAAKASRTIRYQRAVVQAWVRPPHDVLAAEVAFMETRTDRATDAVRDALHRTLRPGPRVQGILAVRFAEAQGWRRNPYVDIVGDELGLEVQWLPPEPILIDGHEFDPARHFGQWRAQDRETSTRLRTEALDALSAALAATPPGEGRWHTIATHLNATGIRTIRGGPWTPENVRKLAGRLRA